MAEFERLIEVPSVEKFMSHLEQPYMRLKLSANYKSVRISPAQCKSIAARLAQNQTLIHLVIRDAKTNDDGTAELAVALEGNIFLQTLCLHQVNLGDPGTLALSHALQKNFSLTELSLKFNHIGEEGAKALSNSLKKNNVLRGLHLDENSVMDSGAVALAEALVVNSSLTILSLSANSIGDEGVLRLGEALKENRNLRSLFLSRNTINPSTASVLLTSLDSNQSLTSFAAPHCEGRQDLQSSVKSKMRANRERKQAAYRAAKAEGEDAKAAWNRSKLMVIGEGKAGKTATVRSLLNKTFDEEWKSTVGVELSRSTTGKINAWTPDAQKERFTVSLLSTLALSHFRNASPPKALTKDKHGTVQSRASASPSPTTSAGPTKGSAMKRKEQQGESEMGKKKRGTEGEGSVEEEVTLAYEEKLFVDAQSNVDAIKMTIWDYGGQAVFYTLHHLFLSKFGVYLLVFDLRKLSKRGKKGSGRDGHGGEPADEFITFWLNSVKLHAPGAPVLLVGTFADEVDSKEELALVNRKVEEMTEERFPQIQRLPKGNLRFHAVDNRSASGIGGLRKAIEVALSDQEYVRFKVPVKWMKCLDKMMEIKDNWVPFKTVHEIGKRYNVRSSSEVVRMLQLFHELGMVLHFTATSQLASTVTLNPSWLVEAIGKVIRDRDIHVFAAEEVNAKKLREDVDRLFSFGLISEDLLQMLWGREAAPFLLDLMRSLLLLSTWNFEQKNVLYLIPSMVVDAPAKTKQKLRPAGMRAVFTFDFLPIGVYERLVCLLVEHSGRLERGSVKPPVLRKNACMVDVGEDAAVFVNCERNEKLTVRTTKAAAAGRWLRIVLAMLKKLNADTMNNGLVWEVELEVDGKLMDHDHVKQKQLSPWYTAGKGASEPKAREVDLDAFVQSLS